MPKAHRKEILRTEAYDIHIIGAPAPGPRDLYHALLRIPWWAAFALIVMSYLLLNAIFAGLYMWAGGVSNLRSTHSSSACRRWARSGTALCIQ